MEKSEQENKLVELFESGELIEDLYKKVSGVSLHQANKIFKTIPERSKIIRAGALERKKLERKFKNLKVFSKIHF